MSHYVTVPIDANGVIDPDEQAQEVITQATSAAFGTEDNRVRIEAGLEEGPTDPNLHLASIHPSLSAIIWSPVFILLDPIPTIFAIDATSQMVVMIHLVKCSDDKFGLSAPIEFDIR
jgi:hypothetical protein